MQLHGNARTCPNSRRLLVERVCEQGWSVAAAAEAAGVTERTVWRWLRRWREEGGAGLRDRSSRPRRFPSQLAAALVEAITSLRRLRMTAAQIAEVLGLALSTVSLWLKRVALALATCDHSVPGAALRDPAELLDVDMDELARTAALVAVRRLRRLELRALAEPDPLQP